MTESLEGKTALITGASSGIGRETAQILAENGANIALVSRSREKLEKISRELEANFNSKTLVAPTDVTDSKQVEKTVEETVKEFGTLDIVVNNAGLARGGEVEKMSDEQYHNMMDVNCDGMFFVARKSLPYLKESDGNFVFIGSFAGKYPRPANPVYAATKWWTRGFAMSLEAQIGDENVAVTTINPSEVRTDFNSEDGEAFKESFEKGEVTEPEDIAEAVLFAARQEKPNTVNELDVYRRDKFSHF